MSPYLFALLHMIWEKLLTPPIGWALSLSHESQLELCVLLLFAFYGRRIVEDVVIGRVLGAEWLAERRRVREWYRYAEMDEPEFRTELAALRRRAEKEEDDAERLLERAGRNFTGAVLRKNAARRLERSRAWREEAGRLEQLWRTIEKERDRLEEPPGLRERVLGLMQRLEAADPREAASALAELNRISTRYDWTNLAPPSLGSAQCERLISLLRLMARTSNLGEARNAYRSARRILERVHADWHWEAA